MRALGFASLLFFSTGFLFGQDEQKTENRNFFSLSAGVQSVDWGHLTYHFDYRRAFNEKWSFTAGFNFNSFRWNNLMTDDLLYQTDTTQIYRTEEQYHKTFTLNTGIAYAPFRYLRIGANLVMGYDQDHIAFHDNDQGFDSLNGVWVWNYYSMRNLYPDLFTQNPQDVSSVNLRNTYDAYLGFASYLVTGGSLTIGGYYPLSKHWEIGLAYTASFLRYTYLNNHSLATNPNFNGMNVYPNIANYITEPSSFNLLNNSLSLSVAFGF